MPLMVGLLKPNWFKLYNPSGVSECIIMGIPMSLGTGIFQLLNR